MSNIKPRASRVDVKKLEKQEAKLKVCVRIYTAGMSLDYHVPQAKIEKRSRRDLYEGSKLLDAHRKQVNTSPVLLFRVVMDLLYSKRLRRCL